MKLIGLIVVLCFVSCIQGATHYNSVQKQRLLANMNGLRRFMSTINPNYDRMPRAVPPIADLVWNNDLATAAQKHADKCTWDGKIIQGNRNQVIVTPDTVGEGIQYFTKNNLIAKAESGGYFYPDSCSYIHGEWTCADFLSVVWHTQRRVGCGVTNCRLFASSNQRLLNMVCFFGSATGSLPYLTAHSKRGDDEEDSGFEKEEFEFVTNDMPFNLSALRFGIPGFNETEFNLELEREYGSN